MTNNTIAAAALSHIARVAAETVQRCPQHTRTYSTVIAVAITAASLQLTRENYAAASTLAQVAAERLDANCLASRGMDFATWVDGTHQPPRSQIVADLLHL